MFLRSIDENKLSQIKKDVFASEMAKNVYDDLFLQKYEIYYSFDRNSHVLSYEAVKDKEYIQLQVDENRDILSESAYVDVKKKALYLFLHQIESEKDEKELQEIYKDDYVSLSFLSSLSPDEIEERKKQSLLLDELRNTLLSKERIDDLPKESKVHLEYVVFEKDDVMHVKIRVSYCQKSYLVNNPYDFLSKYRFDGVMRLGRISLNVFKDNFAEEDSLPLSILSEFSLPKESNSDILLSKESFARLLFSMKGRTIRYLDKTCYVENAIQSVDADIDERGMLKTSVILSGSPFSYQDRLATYDDRRKEFSLYQFKDERVASFCSFLLLHPDFRIDLFQEELAKDIYPLLEENVVFSPDYLKEHPFSKAEIQYYINLSKKDTLLFETKYLLSDREVSKAEFLSSIDGKSKVTAFDDALDFLQLPEEGEYTSQDDILHVLKEDMFPLKKAAKVFLSENLTKRRIVGVGKLTLHVKSDIDWLSLSISSNLYTKEELDEILSAFHQKKKFVRMKDSFIVFDDPDSKKFEELVEDFSLKSVESQRLPFYDALKLTSYSGDEVDVLYGEETRELFEDIKNFKKAEINLDESISRNLRPYQLDGVRWLSVLKKHHLGGILADDMGLGKTLEVIAYLSLCTEQMPVLIVCPKSLIYNWENEFHKWDPKEKVFVMDGPKESRAALASNIDDARKEVFIISYDSLRNDLDLFLNHRFSNLILDEGQSIANAYAKKTKAVKDIYSRQKFVLTGTPIMNSLLDLWSIFDFLMPGYLLDFHAFCLRYRDIEDENQEDREILMKKIAPFVLKRTKKEVLSDLPEKVEQIVLLSMNENQRKLYDAYLENVRNQFSQQKDRITILAEIMRLREICVDQGMLYEGEELSSKILSAMETIRASIQTGHKVIVFSTFAKALFHLRDVLSKENIDSFLIYGRTGAKDRIRFADDFNEKEEVKVMLVSLKAGGTGLNLIGGDIVILLDPWWNLAAENQASDRAHRIGQKRNVTILKLINKDSIEERVLQLQEKKRKLSDVIHDDEEGILNIDMDDLTFLLE